MLVYIYCCYANNGTLNLNNNFHTKVIIKEGGLEQCEVPQSNVYGEVTGIHNEPEGEVLRGDHVTQRQGEGQVKATLDTIATPGKLTGHHVLDSFGW